MCERRVRNHSDNTNIGKCDKKYLKGCDHSLPGFVCQKNFHSLGALVQCFLQYAPKHFSSETGQNHWVRGPLQSS